MTLVVGGRIACTKCAKIFADGEEVIRYPDGLGTMYETFHPACTDEIVGGVSRNKVEKVLLEQINDILELKNVQGQRYF